MPTDRQFDPDPFDPEGPLDPVEELVALCLETPPAERPSTVERVCTEHPKLAGQLKRRLEALDRALTGLGPSQDEGPERLGEFRILRRLGGGGMGVVYEAEQEGLGRVVALKLIRPEQLYFPRARERFRREVEAVAGLQHPGIVPLYAVGEEDGVPYFAMERIHGCTLAEALKQLAGRAPETLSGEDLQRTVEQLAGEEASGETRFGSTWTEACISIVRRVAEALDHAHGRGIVHRDVKPSNIALTPDGRAMLFDFGLTPGTDGERMTRTGSLMGTLPYMSPEQIRDARDVGPRSDLYSLGVTLYELLTLQLPYEEKTPTATQARVMAGAPDSIRTRNRRVEADLETVCLVAMDVDPSRRFSDAGAFAADLAKLQAHLPIRARTPGRVLRGRRWVQRHPVGATATVLGLALLAGIPSALYLQARGHAADLELAYGEVSDALAKEQSAHAAAEEARIQAAAERERATESADMAERSLGFMTSMMYDVSPHERPGPIATVVDMLERGTGTAQSALADHPLARGRMQMTLGVLFIEYGQQAKAIEILEGALVSLESAQGTDIELYRAETRLALSDALRTTGDFERCEELVREQLDWARGSEHEIELRLGLNRLAALLGTQRRFEEVDEVYAELFPLIEDKPESLGMNLINHGQTLFDRGRDEEAEAQMRRGLEIFEELFEPPHPRLAQAMLSLAGPTLALGRLDEAEQLYLRADEMALVVFGEGNQVTAISQHQLSSVAQQRGNLEQAEQYARKALELYSESLGRENPYTAYTAAKLGAILLDRGELEEAAALLDEGIASERQAGLAGPQNFGNILLARGRLYEQTGDELAAVNSFEEAALLFDRASHAEQAAKARAALERLQSDDD